MSKQPEAIFIENWDKYTYDLATGNLFPTVGKGLFKREVVDVQPLPDKRFARVTLWSYHFQREFTLVMLASDRIDCTWVTCYEISINI